MGALLLSLLIAAAPAKPVPSRLPPVDQCASDRSFAAFRKDLTQAIARHDRAALLAALADDVLVDFGGGAGRAEFAKIWFDDQPSQGELWVNLERILARGCAVTGDDYLVPSLGAQFDPMIDTEDKVVAGAGALLLRAPRAGAAVVARLDWDILTVGSFEGPWLPVTMADGRSGFVRSDQVHSPGGYRLTFGRIGGRWRITSFVAGD